MIWYGEIQADKVDDRDYLSIAAYYQYAPLETPNRTPAQIGVADISVNQTLFGAAQR